MMHSSIAIIASLASLASAQTPASCSVSFSGNLALRPASDSQHGTPTFVDIIPLVNQAGLDGHSDPVLVIQYKNGTAVTPQSWDFLTCSNIKQTTTPPGYVPPSTGPTNDYVGIIRPSNQNASCLTLSSKTYNTAGTTNELLLASACTAVAAKYRTFFLEDYIYGENSYGSRLYYEYADDTYLIGSTAHKELQLVTNDNSAGSLAQQLILLQPGPY